MASSPLFVLPNGMEQCSRKLANGSEWVDRENLLCVAFAHTKCGNIYAIVNMKRFFCIIVLLFWLGFVVIHEICEKQRKAMEWDKQLIDDKEINIYCDELIYIACYISYS